MVVQCGSVNYSHIFVCPPFSHFCVGRCYWRHPWPATKRLLHREASSSACWGVAVVVVVVVVLGMQAEPSPDCQLTGLDFPVWKTLVSVGEAGCWETGSEECPGLGSSKLNISNRQAPSVFQYHQPTSLTIGGPCHHAGSEVISAALISPPATWLPSDVKATRRSDVAPLRRQGDQEVRLNTSQLVLCRRDSPRNNVHIQSHN